MRLCVAAREWVLVCLAAVMRLTASRVRMTVAASAPRHNRARRTLACQGQSLGDLRALPGVFGHGREEVPTAFTTPLEAGRFGPYRLDAEKTERSRLKIVGMGKFSKRRHLS